MVLLALTIITTLRNNGNGIQIIQPVKPGVVSESGILVSIINDIIAIPYKMQDNRYL